MDPGLELRLDKIVARVRDRDADAELKTLDLPARRPAHDRILAEIPAALARLKSAVQETNDAVADAGLYMKVEAVSAEELQTIEASFVVSLWPTDEHRHGLVFNVSHDGQLIALLASRHSRTRLKSAAISEADRPFFLDALVSLLEAVF